MYNDYPLWGYRPGEDQPQQAMAPYPPIPYVPSPAIWGYDEGFYADAHTFRQAQTPPPKGGPETARETPHTQHVDLSSMFPGELFLHGPENVKRIALTFDDAVDTTFTPRVLDALAQVKVKGTFFAIGERCAAHPEIANRIVQEGHIIGNHTWNHPNLTKISAQERRYQIQHTEDVIFNITQKRTALFRPPYGALNPEIVREIQKLNYKVIYWNVDSLDWMGLSGPQVTANILAHAKSGSIILQHSAGGRGEDLSGTIAAIPFFVQTLRKEGYTFVTVPELLNIPAYKRP